MSSLFAIRRPISTALCRNTAFAFARRFHNIENTYFIHPCTDLKSAISFSPSKSSIPIGYIEHPGVKHDDLVKTNPSEFLDSVEESQFEENPQFRKVFLDFLKRNIYNDYSYQLEAYQYAYNYMPIYDFRKIPEYGRRSEVDDIYGWVNVDNEGEMVKDSFQPNDMYRFFTKSNGFPQLTDYMKENVDKFTTSNSIN